MPNESEPSRARARLATVAAGALAMSCGALIVASPASAASVNGPEGQTLTVSQADGLNPDGDTITVHGEGYDVGTGIYVGVCVDNGAGQQATPCLGGVDMEGSGGSSAWISSNPPSYGEGLAQPFDEAGGKGSFDVELSVAAADEFTDCLDPAQAPDGCVVATRADHSRPGDRSADVRIPVTFAAAGEGDGGGGAGDGGGGAGDTGGKAETPTATASVPPGDAGDTGGAGGTGSDLAETGSDTAPLVLGGLALLAVGAAVGIARRRFAITRSSGA